MAATLQPAELDIRRTARLRSGAYLGATALLALVVGTMAPNLIAAPMMPYDTHLMASVGGSSPGYPWTYLGAMGGMILIYGLLIPAVFGVRGFHDRHRDLGVLLVAPLTAAFAAYLVHYLLGPVTVGGASGGLFDTVSVVAYVVTPLPFLWAAARLVADGELRPKRVVGGAVLLHLGMLTAMAAANVVGGPDHMPVAHTLLSVLVRWG